MAPIESPYDEWSKHIHAVITFLKPFFNDWRGYASLVSTLLGIGVLIMENQVLLRMRMGRWEILGYIAWCMISSVLGPIFDIVVMLGLLVYCRQKSNRMRITHESIAKALLPAPVKRNYRIMGAVCISASILTLCSNVLYMLRGWDTTSTSAQQPTTTTTTATSSAGVAAAAAPESTKAASVAAAALALGAPPVTAGYSPYDLISDLIRWTTSQIWYAIGMIFLFHVVTRPAQSGVVLFGKFPRDLWAFKWHLCILYIPVHFMLLEMCNVHRETKSILIPLEILVDVVLYNGPFLVVLLRLLYLGWKVAFDEAVLTGAIFEEDGHEGSTATGAGRSRGRAGDSATGGSYVGLAMVDLDEAERGQSNGGQSNKLHGKGALSGSNVNARDSSSSLSDDGDQVYVLEDDDEEDDEREQLQNKNKNRDGKGSSSPRRPPFSPGNVTAPATPGSGSGMAPSNLTRTPSSIKGSGGSGGDGSSRIKSPHGVKSVAFDLDSRDSSEDVDRNGGRNSNNNNSGRHHEEHDIKGTEATSEPPLVLI